MPLHNIINGLRATNQIDGNEQELWESAYGTEDFGSTGVTPGGVSFTGRTQRVSPTRQLNKKQPLIERVKNAFHRN